MKTILNKLAVLTLVLTLVATGTVTFPNADDGVQVINDGPIDEGCKVP